MNDLLGKFKNKAYKTENTGTVRHAPEGKTINELFLKVNNEFKVGDFFDLYGTVEVDFELSKSIWPIPENFELRIRGNREGSFIIAYPIGYVIWMRLSYEKNYRKQFKCDSLEDERGTPYFKIWRAK